MFLPIEKDTGLFSIKLKNPFKLIHNMCRFSLVPRSGSKHSVSKTDMMLMYHMSNGIKVNLPYVITQHMIAAARQKKKTTTIPYGMVLTTNFRHFDILLSNEKPKSDCTTIFFQKYEPHED
jgi:hypothetical protein